VADEQPLPAPNELPAVGDLVIADIHARMAVELERYGVKLQPHNGRDALRDAYEEAVDLAKYSRQLLYERDPT
jgi:metallophosphoesterase superfamily enzyme